MTRVIGVLGGSGGVGASTFAGVLAACAGEALLIDLDVAGGGIDILLGVESVPGARWSGLRVAGGRLRQADLLAGLPRWRSCAVLAADVSVIDAGALHEVLGAAADGPPLPAVVLDLARADSPERAAALSHCHLVVAVVRADFAGLVAANATLAALPDVPSGVVVRRGDVAGADAAQMVSAPLLGTLPALGAPLGPFGSHRLPRSAGRLAAGVLAGLSAPADRAARPRLAPLATA